MKTSLAAPPIWEVRRAVIREGSCWWCVSGDGKEGKRGTWKGGKEWETYDDAASRDIDEETIRAHESFTSISIQRSLIISLKIENPRKLPSSNKIHGTRLQR